MIDFDEIIKNSKFSPDDEYDKYWDKFEIKNRKFFPDKTYDFVLFENGNLFILDFGNNDTWKGAYHFTDKKKIKKVSDWFNEIFEQSENFKEMLCPNEYLIKKWKKRELFKKDKIKDNFN